MKERFITRWAPSALALARPECGVHLADILDLGWRQAYAALATSADRGGVRDLDQLK